MLSHLDVKPELRILGRFVPSSECTKHQTPPESSRSHHGVTSVGSELVSRHGAGGGARMFWGSSEVELDFWSCFSRLVAVRTTALNMKDTPLRRKVAL